MGKKTFNKQIILDLGCGEYKINDKAYGVDIRRTSSVNVVCNIESNLPFKYESVDIVYCRHVLEHIGDLETLLKEITRILKRDGKIVIIVPHFSNSLAYSDYTHRRFFGYYTFDYFSSTKSKYWNVPRYRDDIRFRILKKRLIFRNIPLLGHIFEFIFNSHEWLAYVYESKLSWFLPCFEIEFILTKE